ncbi:MAG: hypothetical protein ABW184_14605 [Sphingobium sp.]
MTDRTTQSTVEFGAPFRLAGFDAPLPAGTYQLSTEEESSEVAGHAIYRRTATILRVESGGRVEYHPVDPAALEKALAQDRTVVRAPPILPAEAPHVQGKWPWRSIPKWVGIGRKASGD